MKKFILLFYLLGIALFSFSCEKKYTPIKDTSNLQLLNPALQNQKSIKLLLANGMKVYLISDDQADKSAVSLAVKAGCWDDPQDYPGLAHFTEHMLFMGSKKYPGEAEYYRFIAERGGRRNAYTAPDRTVYTLSIDHSSFEEGLDRFSRFFIDPLFHPSALAKELHAVDQEYAKNIENDMWRIYQITKETGNQNHPQAHFSTGNIHTLSSITQKEIIAWYQQHYSADQMALCIYSALPLNTLQKWVTAKFSSVPSTQKPDTNIPQRFSSKKQENHIIYVQPVKEIQKLILEWELPQSYASDTTKSAELIAYALGRGHNNNLQQYLKKQHLINDLYVDVSRIGKKLISLEISVDLTDKGIDLVDTIINAIFSNIALLEQRTVPQYLFEEMHKTDLINYQYQSRGEAFNFVTQHAAALLYENIDSYPKNTLLATSYNKEAIADIIKFLTPENCKFFLVADSQKTGINPKHQEKWLGGKYAIRPFSQKIHITTNNLELPPPNPFSPNDFSLITTRNGSYQNPQIAIDSPQGKFFVINDLPFQAPKIAWKFSLFSPLLSGDINAQVLLELYLNSLATHLEPITDQARQFNLQCQAKASADHIEVTLAGFSQKAPLLYNALLETMISYVPSQEDFRTSKEKMLKAYKNFAQSLPVQQAVHKSKEKRQNFIFSPQKKLQNLQAIDYETLQDFIHNLYNTTYLQGVLVGNTSEKTALNLWNAFLSYKSSEPYLKKDHPQKRVFPITKEPYKIVQSIQPSGTGIILTLDEGKFSFAKRATQQILSTALQEAFFTTLRTKQKTAYIAHSWDEDIHRHLFQNFAVQSATHNGEDLLSRFEIFLNDFQQKLPHYISEKRFLTLKNHYLTALSLLPQNEHNFADLLEVLITDCNEDFLWIEKKKEAAQNLSYPKFITLAKKMLSKKTKRLTVMMQGPLQTSEPPELSKTP